MFACLEDLVGNVAVPLGSWFAASREAATGVSSDPGVDARLLAELRLAHHPLWMAEEQLGRVVVASRL